MSDKNESIENCDSGIVTSSVISGNVDSQNVIDKNREEDKDVDSGCIDSSTEIRVKLFKINLNERTAKSKDVLQSWEIYYQQNENEGDTQLHFACIAGLEKVVGALIRLAPHSCLLNIQNYCCQTAMHIAVLMSKPRIVRMLLIAGADPLIRDKNGNTALHLACESGNLQCVKALTISIGKSEIQEAHRMYGYRSLDKSTSFLRKPPQLPFDLEIRNYEGERCVHLAAQGGFIDILRQLVLFGADINSREGKSGRTPLHIAVESANEALVTFLLEECAKLNIEAITYGGLTAYQFASLLNNVNFQTNLADRGAELLTPPASDIDSDNEDVEEVSFNINFI